jgi:hypothetical protein
MKFREPVTERNEELGYWLAKFYNLTFNGVQIRIFHLKLNNDAKNIKDIIHCDYQTHLQAIMVSRNSIFFWLLHLMTSKKSLKIDNYK